MFLTNHTLTGIALSQVIDSPLLLAPTALVSHLAIDALPHFGHSNLKYKGRSWMILATIDNLTALAIFGIALIAQPERRLQIVIGVFFACLPDLLFLLDIFFNRPVRNVFTRFHSRIQWELPLGTLTEVGWGALMTVFILR